MSYRDRQAKGFACLFLFFEKESVVSEDAVLMKKEGRVGMVRLNREGQLHALDSEVVEALSVAVSRWEKDEGVGCIVLMSVGKAFVAGASIKEMVDWTYPKTYVDDCIDETWDRIGRCRKPVVALVNGFALGGGCELMMMCDVVLASEKAKFGQPELGLGIPPGIGGTQRMVRAIGKAKTMDLCLTGRMMDAEEAERSGLVSRVVGHDVLEEEGLRLGHEIANKPLVASLMVKECVCQAFEMPLGAGIRFERRLFQSAFGTKDQKEGMSAFMEKREAKFSHR